ncbi:MAG: GNAT family N-acetyltransferase [Candidatus Omnitrophota bacterium]
MNTPVKNQHLVYDAFLSEQLEKEAYRLIVDQHFDEELAEVVADLQGNEVFLYGKIADTDSDAMEILTRLRFKMVDTLVTLEKDILMEESFMYQDDIRLAVPEDEAAVVAIARNNFEYSRFHADDNIAKEQADRIKGEWVRNYFKDLRGDAMVLGEVNGQVAGFVQLIVDRDTLVIDLIAVDQTARKRKLATQMINYAQQHCRQNCVKYRVGTQLLNVPSLNLYQGLGFRIKSKQYVFHSNI